MSLQFQNLTMVSGILGFLGGLLSFAAGLHISHIGLVAKIRIWRLDGSLKKAHAANDIEQIQELGFLLQVLKLYSANTINQGTAISQLTEFGGEKSFEVLAGRLGSKPYLGAEIKPLLLFQLRNLAHTLDKCR